MPGPLPLVCHFPDDFLQEASRMVRRRTISAQALQRYRLALALHENSSLTNTQAGYLVGLSARQVQRWKQRWQAGNFTVTDESGRGRKTAFSPFGSDRAQGVCL